MKYLPCVCIALLLLASTAQAETVFVKYQGLEDLDSYDCRRTVSSFVNRICYDPQKDKAIVLLGNTYYGYCGVNSGTISNWLDAGSKGKFYNSHIKGKYRC